MALAGGDGAGAGVSAEHAAVRKMVIRKNGRKTFIVCVCVCVREERFEVAGNERGEF